MDILLLAGLIVLGLIFILVEVFLIPGTGISGFIGLALMIVSIAYAYMKLSVLYGNVVLSICFISIILIIFIGFRSSFWEKFALKESSESHFNDEKHLDLSVGQEGKSVSYLRPIGKAEFNDLQYEVCAHDEFIESGITVIIEKIDNHKIFVKPKT